MIQIFIKWGIIYWIFTHLLANNPKMKQVNLKKSQNKPDSLTEIVNLIAILR